ncbi:hypothetical protein RhiJN_16453 [Ceratobasidium sp. AG-Ba]|nr:hypothetical protein RhiJN_16453 [Ceratobasidium sp. AG-Ba]
MTAESAKSSLIGSLECQSSTEAGLQDVQSQADASAKEIEILKTYQASLERLVEKYSQELVAAHAELEAKSRTMTSLKDRQTELNRSREAMHKKIQRMVLRNATAKASLSASKSIVHMYQLKSKSGIIEPQVWDMIRRLVCKGVSTEHIADVIGIVAEALGIPISGSVSARSVSRVMLEGLVQAQIQIGHELRQADYLSICGDGTTIKNIQHEAKSLYIQPQQPRHHSESLTANQGVQKPIFRTVGVQKAVNHTAELQLRGWIVALDTFCSVLNRSPLVQNHRLTSKMVAPKLRGVLTDHAADQKRFFQLIEAWKRTCDREARAVPKLQSMLVKEQLHALSTYLDQASNSTSDWRTMPSEQQAALMHDAWLALAYQIGEAEFQRLDLTLQQDIDFLAWAGCCMHKELNAVKGGVAQMANIWDNHQLTPPIPLQNKFEAEKSMYGAQKNHYSRGAIKLVTLAGALFNNKDDKKGYQSTIDHFFEKVFGYSKRFPDTSNTRYGSYCDAAAELILNLDAYILLMAYLRDAKTTTSFTNIELNVFRALQDAPTLTELATLALYAQAVGHPYIRYVRNGSHGALELGHLHAEVKDYCRAIAEKPELLIAHNTSLSIGALDAQPWERPEVIYKILSLRSRLPKLSLAISNFFKGALQTWERFGSEFDEGGVISNPTLEQRWSAWLPSTNDVSEGLLGQCRQMIRRAPTITDNQRNARVMWPRNNTYQWAKTTLSNSDEQFIRNEARTIDSGGYNKILREEINSALEERAKANRRRQAKATERKSNHKRKLAMVKLMDDTTYNTLSLMKVKDLDDQIDKLRECGDSQVRAKTRIGNKQAKIEEILAGLERRKHMAVNNNGLEKANQPILFDGIDAQDVEECPEDVELSFNGEVLL